MSRCARLTTICFSALGVLAVAVACAPHGTSPPEDFDPRQSSPAQRARIDAARAAVAPVVARQTDPEALLLLEMDELYGPLSAEDRAFLDVLRAQPGGDREVGIPAGVEWVRVEGQRVRSAEGEVTLPLQLVTASVWRDFLALDAAMRKDLGRGLRLGSAYRSPAYQLHLILEFLPRFDYSLEQTLVHVSLPGGSDHNRTERLGVDFVSEGGVDLQYGDPAAFMALPEYRWLQEHAARFGFEPQPVPDGGPVTSPWHWRHRGDSRGGDPR